MDPGRPGSVRPGDAVRDADASITAVSGDRRVEAARIS